MLTSQHQLLRHLILIRKTEEFFSAHYNKEIFRCPIHLSIGQEAPSVAIASSLTLRDKFFSSHRSHAHFIAKGGSLESLFAECLGKPSGCSRGLGGSTHLIDESIGFMGSTSIVAGTIPVAVGVAYAQKIQDSGALTFSFFGDGASEEGVFWESLNLAKKLKAPIVFCLENNNLSCYSNINERRFDFNLKPVCHGLGIEYFHFAKTLNVFELANQISSIISDLRDNPRPVLFEFEVIRRFEHCGYGIDDHLDYREQPIEIEWEQFDPLRLAFKDIHDAHLIEQLNRDCEQQIQTAFDSAFKSCDYGAIND